MQLEKGTYVAVIVKHLMSVAIGLVHFPVLSLPENKTKQLPYLLAFVVYWSHTVAHAIVGHQGIPV